MFDAKKSSASQDVYDNADGSVTVKDFAAPVNYQTSAGAWARVDTSLAKSRSSGRLGESAVGVSAPSFAASAADPDLLTYTFAPGESVLFGLVGAAPVAPSVSGSTAVYANVLPGVTLKLQALAYGVKESVVLASASAPSSFTYTMSLTGLTAQLASDGSIALLNSSGAQVGSVPHGQMADASTAPASHQSAVSDGVSYALTTVGGVPAMAMSLSTAWLDDPARVFPVTVDPTVQSNATASTYALNQGLNNNSGDTIVKVGTCDNGTLCGGDFSSNGFLQFPNIASIYQNQDITAASLVVDQVWDEACAGSSGPLNGHQQPFDVAAITSSWSASTQMEYDGTGQPNFGGAVGSGEPSSSSACNGVGEWDSVGLPASLFNGWTGGTASTGFYGFALYAGGSDGTWKQFASVNTANVPYLLVTSQPDSAPSISGEQPPSGQPLTSLTPELTVNGSDPDNFPGKPLQYEFQVYNDASGTPVLASDSGTLSSGEWVVPSGVLSWAGDYSWQARIGDQIAWSAWSQPSYFGLAVEQPPITSHLGSVNSGPGYDALTGNYTSQATDANVSAIGPALTVQRTYNSADPRVGLAFGAGWSSAVDSAATRAQDGSGDLLFSYADGQEVRFGANANGTFAPPSGTFATVTAASTTVPAGSYCPAVSTGFCLLDKSGTTYAYTVPQTSADAANGPWLLSAVTDAQGRATLFAYTASSSGVEQLASMTACVSGCQGSSPVTSRSLSFTWTSAAALGGGAQFAHVTQVATNPVSGSGASSDLVWTYAYSGDELSAVCDPTEQAGGCAQETKYGYQAGSQFSAGVLDSAPQSYWRLNDPAGATDPADQVLANEGTDAVTPVNVTFGVSSSVAGPNGLAGGPLSTGATVASFNGSSSGLTLPQNLIQGKDYLSVGMWFETSTSGSAQILLSTGHSALNASSPSDAAMPVLYIGTDGKLYGHFWNTEVDGIVSANPVNDGKWHYAVLSAAGDTQTLYLDGQSVGTEANAPLANVDPYDFVGAGVFNNAYAWPAGGPGGAWSYFDGQISDVAYYPGTVGASTVSDLYAAASAPSALLTSITKPSGASQAQVVYNTVSDRVTQVTDADGGAYKVAAPTVSGSSNVYAGAVLGAQPEGYWRLGESSGNTANNEVTAHTASGGGGCLAPGSCDDPQGDGVYGNVTLGASSSSPFSDATGARFNGSSSYVQLPSGLMPATGGFSVGVWFNATSGNGVLLGANGSSITASASAGYDPMLYIGSDGKLNAALYSTTNTFSTLTSPNPVTGTGWHYAVLSSDGVTQTLYLDGQQVASRGGANNLAFTNVGQADVDLSAGAGWIGGGWPDESDYNTSSNAGGVLYFNGELSDVAVYGHALSSATVSAQYADLSASSGLTPLVSDTVTDPLGHSLVSTYDPMQGGRILSSSDANGGVTRYGYDTGGFLYTVTDPLGDVTTTGHDIRGNQVSDTICQDLAAQQCSTSYATYWPDDSSATLTPDPRDDVKTSARDGRSASASDPTYMTTYTYDQYGNQLTSTDPLGRTTASVYTNGTQAAITAPASTSSPAACSAANSTSGTAPSGLLLSTTTPGGAATTDQYYADGDLAVQTSALGAKTIYVYDGVGRVLFKTECSDTYPNGTVTAFTYDGDGRTLTETDPATTDAVTGIAHQQKTSTVYTADGLVQSKTVSDVGGSTSPDAARETQYTYYPSGLVETQSDPTGAQTKYSYDAEGNKTGESDPNGDVWQYTYDGDGNQTATILTNYTGSATGACQPASNQLVTDSKAYDLDDRLADETDAMCRETQYTYFDDGLTATITKDAPSGSSSPNVTETKAYDGAGNLVSDTTGNGESQKLTTFDAAGQQTLVRTLYCANSSQCSNYAGTPLYKYTQNVYNLDGQISSASSWQDDGSGTVETTDYTYDAAGDKLTQSVHQSTPAQTDAAVNLTGQWNLTDGKTTSAQDGSGQSHPATLNGGASWSRNAPSGLTGSLQTDGSTGYAATTGSVLNTTGSFSVSAWVYLTSGASWNTAVAQAGTTASAFYLQGSSTNWAFSMVASDSAGPTAYRAMSSSAPALNTWTQLTGVYTAGSGLLQLYVNGALQSTTATDTTPFATSGPLLIGRSQYAAAPADFWHGNIADAQAYSYALTGDQATELYDGQSLGNQGLAGSWLLNDGAATQGADSSAGGHPVTANGGVSWSSASGGSAQLDGSTGYLATSGSVVNTASSYTVSAWADLASASSSASAVSQIGLTGSAFTLQYNASAGTWAFTLPASDTTSPPTHQAVANTAAALNTWTYLTGVYTASSGLIQLYVNGVLQTSTATDTTPFATSGPLQIGRTQANGAMGSSWPGGISGVSTYGQALTAAQVQTLFNGGSLTGTPSVASTSWTYDKRGEMTSMTAPLGNAPGATAGSYTTYYTNDQLGQLTETAQPPIVTSQNGVTATSAVAPITLTGYDTFGDKAETQDPDGNITVSAFDGDGRVTKTTLPSYTQPGTGSDDATLMATTQTQYNPDGTIKQTTDPAGNVTTYQYDQFGNQTLQTDPTITVTSGGSTSSQAGQTTSVYDQDGELTQSTDPTGAVTQYTYNYLGQKTAVTNPVRQSSLPTESTQLQYDVLGNLVSSQAPGQNAQTYTYDADGETVSATDPAGNTTHYSYNLAGQLVYTANPDTSWTWNGYDLNGNLTYTADYAAGQNATPVRSRSFGYDLDNEQVWASDYMSVATDFGYNADGEQTGQYEPVSASAGVYTSYGYDAAGNRTQETDGNGNTTYTTYNSWGLPESSVVPSSGSYTSLANRATTLVYDLDGNAVQQLSPGGVSVTANYDALGDVTSQTGTGATATTDTRQFGYDLDGDVTAASTANGSGGTDTSDTFTYDDLGDVLSTAGTSGTASFTYNQNGQMLTRTDTAGNSTYTYNPAGELASDTNPLTGTTATYLYNDRDQVSTITYGTGDVQSFGYDDLDRLNTDTLATAATGGTQLAAIDYTYNNDNNETNQTTTGLGSASPSSQVSNTYTYDQDQRLTSWSNGTTTTSYGYDGDGNRTCITTNTAGCTTANSTYTYNNLDQLTADGTNTYTYAPDGTLATKTPKATGTAQVYAFDAYQQMASQGTQTFTYDALGRTVATGSTALKYSGLGNTEISDGSALYALDPNDTITADKTAAAGGQLTLTDQHDNLVAQFAPTATSLSASQTFDPLGNITASTGWTASVGYQSKYTTASGQVDMDSRWYTPNTGQFDSADTQHNNPNPQAVNANPYTYANDNPLTGTDPTGHTEVEVGPGDGSSADNEDGNAPTTAEETTGETVDEVDGYIEDEDPAGALLFDEVGAQGGTNIPKSEVEHEDEVGFEFFVDDYIDGMSTSEQGSLQQLSQAKLQSWLNGMLASYVTVLVDEEYGYDSDPGSSYGCHGTACGRPSPSTSNSSPHGGSSNAAGSGNCVDQCTDPFTPPPPPPPWLTMRSPGAPTCTAAGCVGQNQTSTQVASSPYVPRTAARISTLSANATQALSAINGGIRFQGDGSSCDTGSSSNEKGNIVYLPRHEQAGQCVATGAFATLTKSDYTPPPRPSLNFPLVGRSNIDSENWARGHLIAFSLGGSNRDTRNFVAMYQTANQNMFDDAEDPVLNAIQAGGNEYVDVIPVYANPTLAAPTSIDYIAWGQIDEVCTIENNIEGTVKC